MLPLLLPEPKTAKIIDHAAQRGSFPRCRLRRLRRSRRHGWRGRLPGWNEEDPAPLAAAGAGDAAAAAGCVERDTRWGTLTCFLCGSASSAASALPDLFARVAAGAIVIAAAVAVAAVAPAAFVEMSYAAPAAVAASFAGSRFVVLAVLAASFAELCSAVLAPVAASFVELRFAVPALAVAVVAVVAVLAVAE